MKKLSLKFLNAERLRRYVFHKNHIRVWNNIIQQLKEGSQASSLSLKVNAFVELYGYSAQVKNSCFSCEWTRRHSNDNELNCSKCFFDIENREYAYPQKCLNGVYHQFVECNLTDKERRINLATKIRDFPLAKT